MPWARCFWALAFPSAADFQFSPSPTTIIYNDRTKLCKSYAGTVPQAENFSPNNSVSPIRSPTTFIYKQKRKTLRQNIVFSESFIIR